MRLNIQKSNGSKNGRNVSTPTFDVRLPVITAAIIILIILLLIFVPRACSSDDNDDTKQNTITTESNNDKNSDKADSTPTSTSSSGGIDNDSESNNTHPTDNNFDTGKNTHLTPATTNLSPALIDAAILRKTQDLGTDYTSRIVFLCDSVTYGLKSLSMLVEGRDTVRVWSGPAGSYYICKASESDTDTENLLYIPGVEQLLTLPEAVARTKPEIILITAGADSVSSLSPSEFKECYASIIDSIKTKSPGTKIICMSILPGSKSSGFSIGDAEYYNDAILYAAAEAGVHYLDVASAFAASNGYLRDDYDAGSSRLSTTGLKTLLDLIRTHGLTDSTDTTGITDTQNGG
ncbi:MAG: hypothetical protein GX192_03565 [Clostridiales bacterium]|nr:hypothetical protein [Clostridiales bacterium]